MTAQNEYPRHAFVNTVKETRKYIMEGGSYKSKLTTCGGDMEFGDMGNPWIERKSKAR